MGCSFKRQKVITITKAFKKNQTSLDVNQAEYGQIKGVNFTIDQQNHGYKIVIQKCIQQIMKETI